MVKKYKVKLSWEQINNNKNINLPPEECGPGGQENSEDWGADMLNIECKH